MQDAHKPFGQDMQKKTTDKFSRLKSREFADAKK
jgi:hypothetical protein